MATLSPHEVLLDTARDKLAVVAADGTFEYVNAAARRILGFDPVGLEGEIAFEFIHPEDVDRVRESFLAAARSESSEAVAETYRHRTADGSWVWIESRMSPVEAETLDGFVVCSREVTDRIAAQRRGERLDAIAGVSDDALWLFSADWSELLFVNDAVEEIYGVTPEQLRRDSIAFLDAVHPDHVSRVVDAMDRLSRGESVDVEYRVNDEETFDTWVWVKAVPIVRDGSVVRIAGFSRDVTDRHRREHHLVVMDNLLRHNLRNSLNVVLGATERIEETAPATAESTATIREAARDLLRSADKERRIIEALSTTPEYERTPVANQLARAVADVEREHPSATVATDIAVPESAGTAPTLVGTAVRELIENAVTHVERDDPGVEVWARRRGDEVRVRVNDDATPLPDVEADVLRGEFHAHDTVYHSGGLGLWLVYWCVELSGGSVSVDADAADGNRIEVAVPLATESGVDPAASSAAAAGTRFDRGNSP
ncbi:PAS domain-containing sensor histidine kinase [Halobaculum lipolyticum]|uniref:histidine kinase n=1 Tax=Halobaculum lipolyticum TaxID=3032001 RepID=A0ABD5W5E7_9EURY|nr:PAS domain-containing sensor histidine kinase [Halobaculum sp. DT31]